MSKIKILLAPVMAALLALGLFASVASAQAVPMLFTGTATLNGTAFAGTIEAYSVAGALVGTATSNASGAWTMQVANAALEDQDVFFYVVTTAGARLPQFGTQTQVSAKYDTVGGPGRANVTIAAVTPPAAATATPVPPTATTVPPTATRAAQPTATRAGTPPAPGDIAPGTSALWGAVAAGVAMIVFGGVLMLRRRGSKA